ncbi:MAG: hypothetical protein ACXVB2_21585, partial [Isosphaeraceae bacterium]
DRLGPHKPRPQKIRERATKAEMANVADQTAMLRIAWAAPSFLVHPKWEFPQRISYVFDIRF